MRVEVMQYYGLTHPLAQAGYYETETHKQLTKDIRTAVLEGRLLALCGFVGGEKQHQTGHFVFNKFQYYF